MINTLSLAVIFSFVIQSCATKRLIEYSNDDIPKLISSYNKYYKSVQNFEAKATITFNYFRDGELESESIRAKVYWTQNDSLYLDFTYSILGFQAAKIFIGTNYYIYSNREGQFIRGSTHDDYLQDIFKIDFPLKDWGRTLFISELQLANNYIIDRSIDHSLILKYSDRHIRFRNDYPLPAEIIYFNQNGKEHMKLSFYGMIDVDGIIFPEKIVYYNRTMEFESITEYSSIELNQEFDETFQLRIPFSMEQLNGKN